MCLPAEVREQLGLTDGSTLILQLREHDLLLSTADQAITQAQQAVQHLFDKPDATVEAFLAERYRQAEADQPASDLAA